MSSHSKLLTVLSAALLMTTSQAQDGFLKSEAHDFKMETDYKNPIIPPHYTFTIDSMKTEINDSPIIGVVSQPLSADQKADPRFAGKSSYIQVSYVRWLESSGARVVPIIYGGDWNETLEKLDHLNGVLFCGGSATSKDYISFGKKVFEQAVQKNDEGTYFPLWGTCLGFEDLAQFVQEGVVADLVSEYKNPLLYFLEDPKETRLFGPLGEKAEIYSTYNMTLNHHQHGLSPDSFDASTDLGKFFKPTTYSYAEDGQKFIASMEAYEYPFFGTQFHPEKPAYGFYDDNINHSELSIEYNRYFADFFVDQTKHNFQSWETYADQQAFIVENFQLIVTTDASANVYVF